MRVLIDILHPAHVHFFRNFHNEMEARGHELYITARSVVVNRKRSGSDARQSRRRSVMARTLNRGCDKFQGRNYRPVISGAGSGR